MTTCTRCTTHAFCTHTGICLLLAGAPSLQPSDDGDLSDDGGGLAEDNDALLRQRFTDFNITQ